MRISVGGAWGWATPLRVEGKAWLSRARIVTGQPWRGVGSRAHADSNRMRERGDWLVSSWTEEVRDEHLGESAGNLSGRLGRASVWLRIQGICLGRVIRVVIWMGVVGRPWRVIGSMLHTTYYPLTILAG